MIGGNKRENDIRKSVGFFEGKVIAVNPTREELEDLFGTTLDKDIEYTGEDGDGNTRLKLNFRIQDVKTKKIFNLSFLLTDKNRLNKDETKTQYINVTGATTWSDIEENLPDWFTKYDFRIAKSGEDDVYNFIRTWASKSDWFTNTEFLDWKKLMRGNVSELKEFLTSDRVDTVMCLATVSTQEREGEVKEYQQIYNKFFTYGNIIKSVRLSNPNTPEFLEKAKATFQKNKKDLNALQRFVLNVEDSEYGCKDFYVLEELKEYNSEENIVAPKNAVKTGSDY